MKRKTEISIVTAHDPYQCYLEEAENKVTEPGLEDKVNAELTAIEEDYDRPKIIDIKYAVSPANPQIYSAMIIFTWEH